MGVIKLKRLVNVFDKLIDILAPDKVFCPLLVVDIIPELLSARIYSLPAVYVFGEPVDNSNPKIQIDSVEHNS